MDDCSLFNVSCDPERLADIQREAVCEFVARVNKRAEANMALTGTLEGSHFLAIQQELLLLEGE